MTWTSPIRCGTRSTGVAGDPADHATVMNTEQAPPTEPIDSTGHLSVWGTVAAAVRGDRIDLTRARLGRAVILLAIPMVLEMVMESITVLKRPQVAESIRPCHADGDYCHQPSSGGTVGHLAAIYKLTRARKSDEEPRLPAPT